MVQRGQPALPQGKRSGRTARIKGPKASRHVNSREGRSFSTKNVLGEKRGVRLAPEEKPPRMGVRAGKGAPKTFYKPRQERVFKWACSLGIGEKTEASQLYFGKGGRGSLLKQYPIQKQKGKRGGS